MSSYIQESGIQRLGSKWDPESGPKNHDFHEQRDEKRKADTTKVMSAILSCWKDKSSDVVVHVWVEARDSLVEVFHRH